MVAVGPRGSRSMVDRLRNQALDWKPKFLLAVRDRDVIRTHLALLASGTLNLSSGVPPAAFATTPIRKRTRSREPNLPIKRPRAAKMTRSETESVATPSDKSACGSLQSTGPVQSATSFSFTGASRVSARSSRSARSDASKATLGSARILSTQKVARKKRSDLQAENKRT